MSELFTVAANVGSARRAMRDFVRGLIFVLLAGCPGIAWAGMEEGLAAFNRGDFATAFKEWKPLAEQGDAEAQYNLGVLYQYGRGAPQDDAEAAKWFRQAAEQDDPDAQYSLGVLYSEGRGVDKDLDEAATWLRRAADQGHAGAAGRLAAISGLGSAEPKDEGAPPADVEVPSPETAPEEPAAMPICGPFVRDDADCMRE
jgi:TPR repeat protein